MRHLTEADIRQRIGRGEGQGIRLGPDERLTPAARDYIQAHHIRVVARNAQGTPTDSRGRRLHPLRLADVDTPQGIRQGTPLPKALHPKPEHLTHLQAGELVGKQHPRILLRGKLDSLVADFVLMQTEIGREGELQGQIASVVAGCLAELRSWVGQILRAEVTGEILQPLTMANHSYETIRQFSHHPLRFLHHDHVVPESAFGPDAARLNHLRARAREVELCAVRTFTDADNQVSREDVIMALNRLSSAVYVLMVLVVAWRAGVTASLKEFCPK